MKRQALVDLPMPLFPSEEEIGRAVLGLARAGQWADKAAILERRGLPKIDPFYGGRLWPAVRDFILADMNYGPGRIDSARPAAPESNVRVAPFAPDGVETHDHEKAQAARYQRRARSPRRARA